MIVVDDGSRACCRARYPDIWRTLDERFRLTCVSPDDAPGVGPAAARNTAIAQASGEFLAFCDDDDYWCAEDHLAVAAEALSQVPDGDIYYANRAAFRDGVRFNARRWPHMGDWLRNAPKVGDRGIRRLPHEAFLQSEGIAHHSAPDSRSRHNASTVLTQTERWLALCLACEHIRITTRTRPVMKLISKTQGYTLRHLTMALYRNSQYRTAVTTGAQALSILPGLRWSLFVVYLSIRGAIGSLLRRTVPHDIVA